MADDDGRLDDKEEVLLADGQLKGRGRNRFCKQCKFTCTDSKEFYQHQMSMHSDSEETRALRQQLNSKDGGSTSRRSNMKSPSSLGMSPALGRSDSVPKTNKECEDLNESLNDDDEDTDRLVIAEESNDSMLVMPTRSGNIQNRTYICPYCDFSSTSAKMFLHHQKDIHNKDFLIYECDVCDYATRYKQKLPRHRKLHFAGQEWISGTLSADQNSSSEKVSEEESKKSKVEEEPEDDIEDDDMDPPSLAEETPIDDQKQKKRTRQEVDPSKYFEVMDESGIKYSCSKCGNVYKWRKSLNKHWKEKHSDEKMDGKSSPGLSSSNSVSSKMSHTTAKNGSNETTQNRRGELIYSKETATDDACGDDETESAVTSGVVMPNFIGPFITNSSQPVYRAENSQNAATEDEEVLDLSSKGQTPVDFSREPQCEPLDFSVKRGDGYAFAPGYDKKSVIIKEEPVWDGEEAMANDVEAGKGSISHKLQCLKCAFVAKTLVDYSSHMAVHLNKRAFKCAECQQHFSCVEDLNRHFAESHVEKIKEHRDAIQKIPHGLQQTYHLLKMPLDVIKSLSPQDLNSSSDCRQLKCSLCDFVAKWPAELQKHAVSHSEERPFVCMVCGSTYKWKWDLVKHFEKSHPTLPNPYKRKQPVLGSATTVSRTADALVDNTNLSIDSLETPKKKRRLSDTDMSTIGQTLRLESFKLNHSSKSNLENCGTPLCFSTPLSNPERPSSEPPDLNSIHCMNMYDDPISKIQITNVHSLSPLEKVEKPLDVNAQHSRPASENIHKAVTTALQQKISMLSSKGKHQVFPVTKNEKDKACADILLPYKCSLCQYRARWPSEITQHMKNHSDEKPYCCPRCSYKSKWKWDVVKHLKRCGGGTVKDVIDRSKIKNLGPPNVVVATKEQMKESLTPLSSSSTAFIVNGDCSLEFFPDDCGSSHSIKNNESNNQLSSIGPQVASQSILNLRKQAAPKSSQPLFRGLVNQGLYHCLECQFVGHSPAELKRHSYLHSEKKPFVCKVCSYSSRWKCDLKKHMKTYNHFSGSGSESPIQNQSTQSSEDTATSGTSPARSLSSSESVEMKCNKCLFRTYKRSAFEVHQKMHRQQDNGKRRCKQCNFLAEDLPTFLKHKLTHSNPNNTSASSSRSALPDYAKVSSRTLHLKCRRKPMKQFRCSLCPYACFKRVDLLLHETMHKPRGSDALQCPFCNYNVFNRNLLLQHLQLHPEFDSLDTSELQKISCDSNFSEFQMSTDDENEELKVCKNGGIGSMMLLKNSGSRKESADGLKSKPYRFICEWCDATFAHISTLYQHAKAVHPCELREQEIANNVNIDTHYIYNGFSDEKRNSLGKNSKGNETPKKSQHGLAKVRKSISPGKQGGPFQCQKCPFVGASANTYLRHIERHGSKCKHTCLYCDYSIDRLNLLHQHMRGSHGHIAKQSSTMMLTEKGKAAQLNGTRSNSETGLRTSFSLDKRYEIDTCAKDAGYKSVVVIQEDSTWRGVPLQICSAAGKKVYKCQKCAYISINIANTCNHVRQHGSNRKYECRNCDYSVDSIKLIRHHMETVHAKMSSSFNFEKDNSILRADEEKDKNALEQSFEAQCSSQMLADASQTAECPHCPYKTATKELLQFHLEMHEYKGQFVCEHCDFSVDQIDLLCEHSLLHNTKILSEKLVEHQEKNAPATASKDEMVKNQEEKQKEGRPVEKKSLLRFQLQQMLKQVKISGRVRYKCSRCPYKTCCKNNIIKHRKQHIIKSRYKCQFCNYSAARKYLLQQHLKFHSDENTDQGKEFQDVILDPFDEQSMKVLKKDDENEKTGDGMKNANEKAEADINAEETAENTNANKTRDSNLSNEKSLSKVASGEDEDERNFRCKSCPFRSNSSFEYRRHSQFHETSLKYICDYCSYSVDRLNLITQHRRVHCNEVNFDYNIATATLLNEKHNSSLNLKTSSENDLVHDNEKSASQEMEVEKPENKDNHDFFCAEENMRYKCHSCPYMSNSLKSYNVHSHMHGLKRKYKCDYCNWSADRLNLLNQHRRVHAKEADFNPNPAEITFLNREAALQVKQSIAIRAEQKSKRLDQGGSVLNKKPCKNKKIYSCKLCPFSCNNKNSFANHKSLHRIRARHTCSECSYSVDRWNLLFQHMRLHKTDSDENLKVASKLGVSQKNRLKCPKCPYHCHSQDLLQVHISMHDSGKKYKCDYCDYSIDRWNLLQQHIRVHGKKDGTPQSNDSYKVFNHLFQNQLYLSSQDNEAAEEKSSDVDHTCDRCPFTTGSVAELELHKAQHNNRNKVSCPYCDYSCSDDAQMLNHVQVHFLSASVDLPILKHTINGENNRLGVKPDSSQDTAASALENPKEKPEAEDSSALLQPSEDVPKQINDEVKTIEWTESKRVYVCQYCEREFDEKNQMLLHEKQHLIGNQVLEPVQ